MIKRFSMLLTILIFLFISQNIIAQDKVDVAIQFITNDNIAEVNFNTENFIAYAKTFLDKCKSNFENETIPQEIIVLLTFHKSESPTIQLFYRPEYDKTKADKFLIELRSIKPIKSLLVDFSLAYIIKTNGGVSDQNTKFEPELILPDDIEEKKLRNSDLSKQVELIKSWAIDFAIPVIQAYEVSVDDKFVGVKEVGRMLLNTDFSKKQDIIALTERNSNYWRAIMEMSVGNQLIPMTKICMHIANGEFDYANIYLEIIQFFVEKKTVANYLASELSWRLQIFNDNLNSEIQKGIDFHDKNQYDNAINQYISTLQKYPNSAWANYELYFSRNAQSIENGTSSLNDRSDWDLAKPIIYACNPLYHMDVRAGSNVEGYLLFRRQSILELFKVKEKYNKDFVEYADIALDLKAYGFAAQLYWLIISSIPKETFKDQDILSYLLYCLDKLGDTEIKKNFKGDFEKEFKKVEKELKKQMENSPNYKLFKSEKG